MDNEYSGMIYEDHSKTANLPQDVIIKDYPKSKYLSGDLDDTMKVVDKDRDMDIRTINANKSKVKY